MVRIENPDVKPTTMVSVESQDVKSAVREASGALVIMAEDDNRRLRLHLAPNAVNEIRRQLNI